MAGMAALVGRGGGCETGEIWDAGGGVDCANSSGADVKIRISENLGCCVASSRRVVDCGGIFRWLRGRNVLQVRFVQGQWRIVHSFKLNRVASHTHEL